MNMYADQNYICERYWQSIQIMDSFFSTHINNHYIPTSFVVAVYLHTYIYILNRNRKTFNVNRRSMFLSLILFKPGGSYLMK